MGGISGASWSGSSRSWGGGWRWCSIPMPGCATSGWRQGRNRPRSLRVSGPQTALGGGADLCLARTQSPPEQGLRGPACQRGGLDLRRFLPAPAPSTRGMTPFHTPSDTDDVGLASGQRENLPTPTADEDGRARPLHWFRLPIQRGHPIELTAEVTAPSAKSPRSTRSASSSRLRRTAGGSYGIPACAYSRWRKPAPSPSSTRPSDRASSVATSRARVTGWRKSLARTNVPSRRELVASAAAARAGKGQTVGRGDRARGTCCIRALQYDAPCRPSAVSNRWYGREPRNGRNAWFEDFLPRCQLRAEALPNSGIGRSPETGFTLVRASRLKTRARMAR